MFTVLVRSLLPLCALTTHVTSNPTAVTPPLILFYRHLRQAAGNRGQTPKGGLRAAAHHRAEPRLAATCGPAHDAVEARGHARHHRGGAAVAHPQGSRGAVESGVLALAQGGLHVGSEEKR